MYKRAARRPTATDVRLWVRNDGEAKEKLQAPNYYSETKGK